MDVVVIDSSTPPASPSHHQPQQYQCQCLSRGRGMNIYNWLNYSKIMGRNM